MKEFIEKLISKLNEAGGCDAGCEYDKGWDNAIGEAIEIVNQLAKEFAPDINVGNKAETRISRIRSMSVEELADAILKRSEISTTINFCQIFSECEKIMDKGEEILNEMCKKCLIKYLNSPVEQKKVIPTDYYMERFTEVI